MSLPTLTTERLVVRPLRATDATAVFRLVNDYSVAGNLARVPFPYRESAADSWIASTHEQAARGEGYHLAITHDDVLIGSVGLTLQRSSPGEAELGYWIGARFWRRGFAREAARALLDWGFGTLGLDRVLASALTDNVGSQGVLRALGFTDAGQGVQDFMSRNRAMPVLMFEMAKQRAEAPALPLLLVVACALVDADGRVLLAHSIWEEPMGGVALELMAAGKNIIVTRNGGLYECAGEAALVYENGNSNQLAECMLQLLKNPALREQQLLELEVQLKQFDPSVLAVEYVTLYKRILFK